MINLIILRENRYGNSQTYTNIRRFWLDRLSVGLIGQKQLFNSRHLAMIFFASLVEKVSEQYKSP